MRMRSIDSPTIQRKKTGFRIPIINERFLTQFVKILASPYEFNRRTLTNFSNFISGIDKEYYSKDVNTYALILSVDTLISCQIDGESDRDAILSRLQVEIPEIYADVKENIIYPTILGAETTKEKEVTFIKNTINTYTKYGAIISKKDMLTDVVSDISSGNVNNLDDSLEEFRNLLETLNDEFKQTDHSEDKFSFIHTSDEDFLENMMKETYKQATSAKLVLKTGIKRFNELLSVPGGFLGGKFYIFYADTNSFKSALLLYISKWIQQYNSDAFYEEFLLTKKRPTILYVSLENADTEDTQRQFTAYTKRDIGTVGNFNDVRTLWTESYNATKSIIDITVLHTEDNMFGMKDLKDAVKRLDDDGYKVVAVLIDSFDLMSPNDENKFDDDRTKLSGLAKSMAKFSKEQSYPTITVHQLNRDGNKSISEKKTSGAVNLAKSLGRQYISGAYDIERRVMFSAFIYLEQSPYDGKLYLEIMRGKCRYRKSDIEYFAHELQGGFVLEDDFLDDKYKSLLNIAPVDDGGMYGSSEAVGGRGVTKIKGTQGIPNSVTIKKENDEKKENEINATLLKIAYSWAFASNFVESDFISFNSDSIVESTPFSSVDENGFAISL